MGLIIFLAVIAFISILPILFPVKCPKCNKKCREQFYMPGCIDSFYYECPEHGDIDNLIEKHDK